MLLAAGAADLFIPLWLREKRKTASGEAGFLLSRAQTSHRSNSAFLKYKKSAPMRKRSRVYYGHPPPLGQHSSFLLFVFIRQITVIKANQPPARVCDSALDGGERKTPPYL